MLKWKYFFYNLLIITLCCFNNILAYEHNEQTLYLNILDVNGDFEDILLDTYDSINNEAHCISLERIPSKSDFPAKLYRLTRECTAIDTTHNNIKEEYILRICNNSTIEREYITIDIEENPIFSSYFSTYLYVKVKDKTKSNIAKEGMLPFLNTEHLKLMQNNLHDEEIIVDGEAQIYDYKIKAVIAMNELLDVARCSARQLKLHSSIKNLGLLNTFTVKNITLLEIPDDTLFAKILYGTKHNINKLLACMYNITKIVESLHKNNIVLGDINLTNLFTLNNKIVLGGFERFSVANDKENHNIKHVVSNTLGYAPEIKTPYKNYQLNYYQNASEASDIYSLGMLFTELLYAFAACQFDINKLVYNEHIYECIEPQKIQLTYFDRYPYLATHKLKSQIPFYNSHFFYQVKDLFGYYFRELKEDSSDTLAKLIEIINLCHQKFPENRPTASKIKDMLEDISPDNIANKNTFF